MVFYRVCVADALRFLMFDISLQGRQPIAYLTCLGEIESGLSLKTHGEDLCLVDCENESALRLRLREFSSKSAGEGVYFVDGETHAIRWTNSLCHDVVRPLGEKHAVGPLA